MNHINSYPSIYALGHRAIRDLFNGPVVVQEKVDGSQFSMSRIDGVLSCRSKGQQLVVDAPEKMFDKAVETAQSLDLKEGWVYRCEYLKTPKHNTLAYERVPVGHLIVFDVMVGVEEYLGQEALRIEAARLGLEVVPCFYEGQGEAITKGRIEELLHNDSILGGCKVEGVVIKNYSLFTPDKKIAIAKFVSESFKEKHIKEWKVGNPTATDVVQLLIAELKTEARWNKAIQHLKEAGQIANEPKDIGVLLKEVQSDTQKEEADYIKERLFKHFWPHIQRGIISGLPEWYKDKLAESQFQPEEAK